MSLQSQSHPPKKNVIATLEAKCDTLEKRLQASEKEKASLEEVLMLMKEHEKKKFGDDWSRIHTEAYEANSIKHHLRAAFSLMAARLCPASKTGRPASPTVMNRGVILAGAATSTPGRDGVMIPQMINEEDWEKYSEVTGLLFPSGPLKFKWDLYVLGLIVYSSISVPFRLGMSHPADGTWWFIEVFVGLCFIADLVLSFRTSFLNGDQLVLDKAMIRDNYLRSWFLLDLVSSLPLELIDVVLKAFSTSGDDGSGGSSGLKALRALRLVRLLRLLRLLKIQKYINQLEDALTINLNSLQLVKVVGGICYLMHLLGCAWFWLADNAPEGRETWITQYGLIPPDAGVWYLYSVSIYWALTTLTTVGYGDIVPANETERMYALMTLLLGALVFGFLLSNVSELVKNSDQNAIKIEEKLDQVKVYLRWHRFRPELATRVKRYFEFFYSRKSAMDEDEIVSLLAPTLRHSVHKHLLRQTVKKIPIFASERSYAELKLQLAVHHALLPLLREAKESIVESLEKGAYGGLSIYFLRRGTVCAQGDIPDVEFFEIDASYDEGAIVGEHALMKRGIRSPYTLRAKTRCELYALGVSDLHEITCDLDDAQRDEMAEIIMRDYVKRTKLRAITMQLVYKATMANAAFDADYKAAIRLQARWLNITTSRLLSIVVNSHNLQQLFPGVYRDTTLRKDADMWSGTTMSMEMRGASFKKDKRSQRASREGPLRSREVDFLREQVEELQEQLGQMEEHLANIPTSEQLTETIQRATQQAMKAVLQEATLHEPPSEQHAEQPSAPPSQQAASGPTLIAPPPASDIQSTASIPRRSPRRLW